MVTGRGCNRSEDSKPIIELLLKIGDMMIESGILSQVTPRRVGMGLKQIGVLSMKSKGSGFNCLWFIFKKIDLLLQYIQYTLA